jgi:hypothetical protein
MTTYAFNTSNGATSTYTNYDFDSFCVGSDGTLYGLKKDGLYRLVGETDNGRNIHAEIDLGDLKFGSSALKHCNAVYLAVDSALTMEVEVNGYEYHTRGSSPHMKEQRADIGKGQRHTFFAVKVRNRHGAAFALESAEVRVTETERRI